MSDAHLSVETKAKIRAMLREISGDRKYRRQLLQCGTYYQPSTERQRRIHRKQIEHIHQMFELTDDSLTQMNVLLSGRKGIILDKTVPSNIENEIKLPQSVEEREYQRHQQSRVHLFYRYHVYGHYHECEKLGDYQQQQ